MPVRIFRLTDSPAAGTTATLFSLLCPNVAAVQARAANKIAVFLILLTYFFWLINDWDANWLTVGCKNCTEKMRKNIKKVVSFFPLKKKEVSPFAYIEKYLLLRAHA
jgi:hypothetical protein